MFIYLFVSNIVLRNIYMYIYDLRSRIIMEQRGKIGFNPFDFFRNKSFGYI